MDSELKIEMELELRMELEVGMELDIGMEVELVMLSVTEGEEMTEEEGVRGGIVSLGSSSPTPPTLVSGITVRSKSILNTTIFSNTLRQEYVPLSCDVTEGMVMTGNEDDVSPFGSIHLPSPVLTLQVRTKLAVFCSTFSAVLFVYSPSLSTLPSTLICPPSTIKHSCNYHIL